MTEQTLVITGQGIARYRAVVIASALELYAKTGMKVNRAYTPGNMLRTAGAITGQTFRRGQYREAAAALRAYANPQATGHDGGSL